MARRITLIQGSSIDPDPERRLIRSSGPSDNPKTAVHQYLKTQPEFEIDKQIDHKLLISVAPDGYLKRLG
ncbi:CmcI family methyltransferase [Halochromatium roseum]|uniref:CmcI family methyltransferase n=1 Tax=Halochromatium roseum TaxID=391920 RepID=UPI001A9193D3|nr:CmcI family methyltransferase [Halochromatium roseum]